MTKHGRQQIVFANYAKKFGEFKFRGNKFAATQHISKARHGYWCEDFPRVGDVLYFSARGIDESGEYVVLYFSFRSNYIHDYEGYVSFSEDDIDWQKALHDVSYIDCKPDIIGRLYAAAEFVGDGAIVTIIPQKKDGYEDISFILPNDEVHSIKKMLKRKNGNTWHFPTEPDTGEFCPRPIAYLVRRFIGYPDGAWGKFHLSKDGTIFKLEGDIDSNGKLTSLKYKFMN